MWSCPHPRSYEEEQREFPQPDTALTGREGRLGMSFGELMVGEGWRHRRLSAPSPVSSPSVMASLLCSHALKVLDPGHADHANAARAIAAPNTERARGRWGTGHVSAAQSEHVQDCLSLVSLPPDWHWLA